MMVSPLRLHRALMLLATLALAFALLVFLLYAANIVPFPFDYDQGEGFELHDSVLFSRFQLPYRDIERYPFYASNYPPLYHALAAPLIWIFGPVYGPGRLMSCLATIVSALAIAFAVYRDGGRHRWIALLSGLAFLASNFVYHIGSLYRQHALMVCFETLAIVVLSRAVPANNRRAILLGLLLLICAGYTKQLAAISALACFGWMFLRRPRLASVCGGLFLAVAGAIFLWLNLASGGHWWTHAVVANVNAFDPWQSLGLFALWLKLHAALLLPALILVLIEMYRERISLYSLWFVFAALLGGITAGTWGAGDSYFTTSIAAACILSGIFFSRLMGGTLAIHNPVSNLLPCRFRRAWLIPILVPCLYLAYARATLKMPTDGVFAPIAQLLGIAANVERDFFDSATYDVKGYANIGHFVREDDARAGNRILALIHSTGQPILSEEAGFSIAAGRDVIGNPTQLRNLHLAGAYEGQELLRMIRQREFGLIILRAQFYPPPVLEAIGQAYEQSETARMNRFDYLILRPKAARG